MAESGCVETGELVLGEVARVFFGVGGCGRGVLGAACSGSVFGLRLEA